MSSKLPLSLLALATLVSHAPQTTPSHPATPPPTPPKLSDTVAGIPVNYDESKVGGYTLSDPLLLALIAPRPVLLQTGSTDLWSDPKGEFLSEVAAGPVYRLLGRQDLGTTAWPSPGTPILSNGLNYFFMHVGGHGMIPTDWDIYLQFLQANLHPTP
ncbi:MAG: hypothetical protein M3O02_13085 [Acidobacteriota bacterium]|nr:hypothetical protein [Acidobacteriota bacterium]